MDDPDASSSDPAAAARLKARLLLEQTVNGNRRILVHSGELQLGQHRSAVFDVSDGVVIVGSSNTIHIEVVQNAGRKVEIGRYLSGFVCISENGVLEWITSGALSSFPPDDLSLPFFTVEDMIRGTGVRIASA